MAQLIKTDKDNTCNIIKCKNGTELYIPKMDLEQRKLFGKHIKEKVYCSKQKPFDELPGANIIIKANTVIAEYNWTQKELNAMLAEIGIN